MGFKRLSSCLRFVFTDAPDFEYLASVKFFFVEILCPLFILGTPSGLHPTSWLAQVFVFNQLDYLLITVSHVTFDQFPDFHANMLTFIASFF